MVRYRFRYIDSNSMENVLKDIYFMQTHIHLVPCNIKLGKSKRKRIPQKGLFSSSVDVPWERVQERKLYPNLSTNL